MPTEYDLAYRQSGTGLPYRNEPTSPQVKTISQQAQPQPAPTPQPSPTPVVSISGETHVRRGKTYYRFQSTALPNGMYAEGDWLMDNPNIESNYEKAVQDTSKFLGINRWDIAGQEKTAPSGIDIGATQRRLSEQNAITKAQEANVRAQQDFMKSNWGGRPITSSGAAVLGAPVGANIKQYESAVPTERKQIAMKRGMLENTKTWASTKAYEDAYAQVSRSTKVTPQKEIYVPEPLKEQEKQFDNKIIPSPSHDDLVRYDAMRIKAGAEQGSVYVDRFGKMVPKKEDTTNRDILRDTTGGRFAQQSYEWGEGIKSTLDKKQSELGEETSLADRAGVAIGFGVAKTGVDIISSGGMFLGGVRGVTEKPFEFAKELPSAAIKSVENLPTNIISPITSPIEKRGLAVGGAEAVGNIGGMYLTGKVVSVVGRTAVRSGVDVVKGTPRGLKSFVTSEEASVFAKPKRPVQRLELVNRFKQKTEVETIDLTKETEKIMGKEQATELALKRKREAIKLYGKDKGSSMSDLAPDSKIEGGMRDLLDTKKISNKKTVAHTGDELRGISGYTDTPTYTWEDPIFLRQLAELRASEKVATVQKTQPSFAEYSAITGAQAAGQIQRTKQITGQLTGQQTKQVQRTDQLTGLQSLNITGQQAKQKTNTEQIVSPVSALRSAQVQSPFTIQSPAMDTVIVQTPKTTLRQTPRTTTQTTTRTTTRTPTKPKEPKYPKILDESEDFGEGKNKKKKGKGKGKTSNASPDFWFPASYESVTKEEMSLGGKRATHIGKSEKKKTSTLYGKQIVTRGKPIPTKRQFKASDLL